MSRLAFDQVAAERDRAVAQAEKLLEHLTRMDRVEHGVPERPRSARSPIMEMPKRFQEYLAGFSSQAIRDQVRSTAIRRAASGVPWDAIVAQALSNDDEPEGEDEP